MGVMKRVAALRSDRSLPAAFARELWDSGVGRHLLPEPVRLHGERPEMLPHRDPEAFQERKRSAREAAKERAAIQAERPAAPAKPLATIPPIVPRPFAELTADDPGLGDELPIRAADGWYRYGRTFYRVGSGPVAGWGFPSPSLPPATRQGMLF
jgi:hypothetical protein